MNVEIQPNPEYLLAVLDGTFSLEGAKRTFIKILEALTKHKTAKVLVDAQGVVGQPRTMERFQYAEFVAGAVADYSKRGVKPDTKFSYVMNEPTLDPERFGETVAVNRGMLVRAFDNHDEALGWLRQD